MEVFKRFISGERVDKVETVFVAKDGQEIVVEGSANYRFERSKPVSTRGIFRDIVNISRTGRTPNIRCKEEDI